MMNKAVKYLFRGGVYFIAFTVLWVIVYRFIPVPLTFLQLQRCIEQRLNGETITMEQEWISLEEMGTFIQVAVIASEDQLFTQHNGFDFNAMKQAWQNDRKSNLLKGASTISQQTAKNVFLWQGRSYIRKAFEAYFTILIELIWGKPRILEIYLNVVEFGNGIYGIEAASQHYYNKSAKNLSKKEAVSLAVILPNPRVWNPAKLPKGVQQKASLVNKDFDTVQSSLKESRIMN